jgi:hypothetical protein
MANWILRTKHSGSIVLRRTFQFASTLRGHKTFVKTAERVEDVLMPSFEARSQISEK